MNIDIYVDGSFNPLKQIYGCGGVVVVDSEVNHSFSATGLENYLVKYHNVAGEVMAAMGALQYVVERVYHEGDTVTLYHDYEGLAKWPTKQWRANNMFSQSYVKFISALPFKLQYKKVKAHTGDKFNELADSLAKKAAGLS